MLQAKLASPSIHSRCPQKNLVYSVITSMQLVGSFVSASVCVLLMSVLASFHQVSVNRRIGLYPRALPTTGTTLAKHIKLHQVANNLPKLAKSSKSKPQRPNTSQWRRRTKSSFVARRVDSWKSKYDALVPSNLTLPGRVRVPK